MGGLVAYGDPSWARFTDGEFDFMPVVVAIAVLLVWRTLFGARIPWQLALGTLLGAALLVDVFGAPALALAVLIALMAGSTVARAGRRRQRPDQAPPRD